MTHGVVITPESAGQLRWARLAGADTRRAGRCPPAGLRNCWRRIRRNASARVGREAVVAGRVVSPGSGQLLGESSLVGSQRGGGPIGSHGMAITNPGIPVVYNKMRLETPHEKCIVMLYLEPHGDAFAYAVATASNGRLLAWDGIYYAESDDPPNLASLNWDEWDDMASKLIIATQTHWVNQQLGHLLMPSFSPARAAAELVYTNADDATTAETAADLRNARVVAYLPVVDDDVYERELAALIDRHGDRSVTS